MARIINRRALTKGLGLATGALMLEPSALRAAGKAETAVPPSVVTVPPRRWGKDAPPNVFPDPDVLAVDQSFNRLIVRYSPILRLGTGYLWAEGPAWSGEGQYLLFSDVQGDTQYRYIWGTDLVIPFRKPSFNSNGNCFDLQGRQLSCQHYFRRVVRWELDGAMTVVADRFENLQRVLAGERHQPRIAELDRALRSGCVLVLDDLFQFAIALDEPAIPGRVYGLEAEHHNRGSGCEPGAQRSEGLRPHQGRVGKGHDHVVITATQALPRRQHRMSCPAPLPLDREFRRGETGGRFTSNLRPIRPDHHRRSFGAPSGNGR